MFYFEGKVYLLVGLLRFAYWGPVHIVLVVNMAESDRSSRADAAFYQAFLVVFLHFAPL